MFGSLWGKKKEPTILGGKSNGVPGMPSGLYSSKDVENLRFHDKRRVWYDAKQVDDALDVIQATLEWWESKYGLKPASGTEPADAGSGSSVEAGADSPLGVDVDHLAGHDEVDSVDNLAGHDKDGSEPVLGEQAQADIERAVNALVSEPETADEHAEDAPAEDPAGETTAVITGGPDGAAASTTDGGPAYADNPESEEHEPTFDAVRAKPTVKPVPTFDLNTIAPYMVVGAGKAVDGVVRIGDPAREKRPLEEFAELVSKEASVETADSGEQPVSKKPVGELNRVYHEWARLLSAGKKPVEDPVEPASETDSGEPADGGDTTHAVPSIKVPEVPPVPVIPTNPFLRRG